MDENERREIVEGGPVWLRNGLRASFAGWKNEFWRSGYGWLGYRPRADDYQTPEDYEQAAARELQP